MFNIDFAALDACFNRVQSFRIKHCLFDRFRAFYNYVNQRSEHTYETYDSFLLLLEEVRLEMIDKSINDDDEFQSIFNNAHNVATFTAQQRPFQQFNVSVNSARIPSKDELREFNKFLEAYAIKNNIFLMQDYT